MITITQVNFSRAVWYVESETFLNQKSSFIEKTHHSVLWNSNTIENPTNICWITTYQRYYLSGDLFREKIRACFSQMVYVSKQIRIWIQWLKNPGIWRIWVEFLCFSIENTPRKRVQKYQYFDFLGRILEFCFFLELSCKC